VVGPDGQDGENPRATVSTTDVSVQVLETPDYEAFSDKREALKAFQDFRRKLALTYQPPAARSTDKDNLQ